jgi:Fic family protein
MNLEDFQNPSGKLIKAQPNGGAYWAFIPDLLPPSIIWDSVLVQALSRADRALGELSGLGRAIPNPHLLIGPFLRREAVLSSRIEGTQTDIADLYVYEAGQLSLPGMSKTIESDAREVLNYVRALEYGLKRLNELPVCLRFIRELHQILLHGVRGEQATPGEFRRSQNWIGKPGCSLNEATYVPPPVPEMKEELGELEKYLHSEDDTPPLVKLALIHYQFEAIHPFLDGNGRIGRLLISLLLVHWNLLPLPLLYLSAYFEQNRQDYYKFLTYVSQQSAWREWLLFFTKGVAEQSQDAIVRARRLQDLQVSWRLKMHQERSSGLTLAVADSLFEEPIITPNRVVKRFDVSHQTAMIILNRLEKLHIVKELTERKRNRVYYSPEIMSVVE